MAQDYPYWTRIIVKVLENSRKTRSTEGQRDEARLSLKSVALMMKDSLHYSKVLKKKQRNDQYQTPTPDYPY